MPTERHTLLDGRVHVYRRENSRFWQCAIYLRGRNHRASTHQDRLDTALTVAREWALDRIAEDRLGSRSLGLSQAVAMAPQLSHSSATAQTFKEAAEAFMAEYRVLTAGERNARYVENKERHLKLYLLPFFGKRPVSEVTAGLIQQYRVARLGNAGGKRPARSTLHQETVTLRQVLKSANRHGWIAAIPDMSAPYKTSGKIAHRAWFSPEEYERLRAATEERARSPKRDRWRAECQLFHDFVEFMANTGLRPDEAQRLEFRDVKVVMDGRTRQRILEIDVRGKRGVGFCKSTPDAVAAYERLLKRRGDPDPTDLVFGKIQRQLMNAVLDELGLKTDRDGNPRTAYSLRHTYICLRLLEGADIYQVAKNCRTSVEMIEKFYASHIKTRLDAAALNGRSQARKTPSATKALANA
jgi:integrase